MLMYEFLIALFLTIYFGKMIKKGYNKYLKPYLKKFVPELEPKKRIKTKASK